MRKRKVIPSPGEVRETRFPICKNVPSKLEMSLHSGSREDLNVFLKKRSREQHFGDKSEKVCL